MVDLGAGRGGVGDEHVGAQRADRGGTGRARSEELGEQRPFPGAGDRQQRRLHPHFQGGRTTHAQATLEAEERAGGKREDYAAQQLQAGATMTERYAAEVAAEG